MNKIDISSSVFKFADAAIGDYGANFYAKCIAEECPDEYALLKAYYIICTASNERELSSAFKNIKAYCGTHAPTILDAAKEDGNGSAIAAVRWEAYYFLGECYRNGAGIERDYDRARNAYSFVLSYVDIYQKKIKATALTFLSNSAPKCVYKLEARIPKALSSIEEFVSGKLKLLPSPAPPAEEQPSPPPAPTPVKEKPPSPPEFAPPPVAPVREQSPTPAPTPAKEKPPSPPEFAPPPVAPVREQPSAGKVQPTAEPTLAPPSPGSLPDSETGKLVEENAALEKKLEILADEIRILRGKLSESEALLEESRETVKIKEEQIRSLELTVRDLRVELSAAMERLEAAEEQLQSEDADDTRSRIKELEMSENAMKALLDASEQKTDALNAEIAALNERIAGYEAAERAAEAEIQAAKHAEEEKIRGQQLPFKEITAIFNAITIKHTKALSYYRLNSANERDSAEQIAAMFAALKEAGFEFADISCDPAVGHINNAFRSKFELRVAAPEKAHYIYYTIAYNDYDFHSFFRDSIVVYPNPLIVMSSLSTDKYDAVFAVPRLEFRWEHPYAVEVVSPFVLKRQGSEYVTLLMRNNKIRQRDFRDGESGGKNDRYKILTDEEYRTEIFAETRDLTNEECVEVENRYRKIEARDAEFLVEVFEGYSPDEQSQEPQELQHEQSPYPSEQGE